MLASPAASFMAADGDAAREALLTPLFTPTETCSLEATADTKGYLVTLEEVKSKLGSWSGLGLRATWCLY